MHAGSLYRNVAELDRERHPKRANEPAAGLTRQLVSAVVPPRDCRLALLKLATVAVLKDVDTAAHMLRVGQVSGLLAFKLTGDGAYAERVCRAAPFHDIGKICTPDAILKKPGPLSADEWQEMRRHAEIGARLLHVPGDALFEVAEEIALGHHEKFDGTGYPRGTTGKQIPLSARVAAVADYFDAMTMDRCYRPAFGLGIVIEQLKELAGRSFDPDVVATLLTHLGEVQALTAEVNRRAAERGSASLNDAAFAPLFLVRP